MSQQAGEGATKINWQIINALRGLAALYVVIHHARHKLFSDTVTYAEMVKPKAEWGLWEWINVLLLQQTSLGIEFVILFFILSGFSISHSLSNHPELFGFYKRRLIRLYPTYLTGILWAIVVFIIIRYTAPVVFYQSVEGKEPLQLVFRDYISVKNIIFKLFYFPQVTTLTIQFWSLPLEVIFYLVAPFAIKKFRWFSIAVLMLYIAGWFLYGIDHHRISEKSILPQLTFDYGIYFVLGMIFYKYREVILNSFKLSRLSVYVLLFIIFETVVFTKSYAWHHEENKLLGILMVIFSFILLFGFLKHSIHIKWLEHIGEYSYTLYVSHVATIQLVSIITFHMGMGFYVINSLYVWYAGIILSLIFGWLLYWVGEYPSTKYLEKLRKKPG